MVTQQQKNTRGDVETVVEKAIRVTPNPNVVFTYNDIPVKSTKQKKDDDQLTPRSHLNSTVRDDCRTQRDSHFNSVHNLFWNRYSGNEFGIPVRAYWRGSKYPNTFIILSDRGDHGQSGELGGTIFYTEEEALNAATEDLKMEISFYAAALNRVKERLEYINLPAARG